MEAKNAAKMAVTLEERLVGQKQIKALESQRNQKRCTLFGCAGDIDRQREVLIEQIEGKLSQSIFQECLFFHTLGIAIRGEIWRVARY